MRDGKKRRESTAEPSSMGYLVSPSLNIFRFTITYNPLPNSPLT